MEKIYTFSIPQPSREFEVKAKSKEEAKEILENCDDLADYEIDNSELWQPDFELIDEREI